ncbi:TetR/AcrR family transcriptional regulator [Emcibacter nanhaiensis]|uniref:TetR/AcrR family transcriptional regulator n=1 Tax=Emcibacter nanhaiensis TaxID=1505037 RepID=A0A501PBS8_9PROT|nr:TetR/AcrR family transcriptional regulator [Emcibacter nanhaiensis]TPD57541.1 TetR/AcrR family transcriptional regulator [Emcibacter nanhaiensis]
MARTQAADYDDRRRNILIQAANLFAEKGYARTSISELATACNASKSWLYHYYPSKEAILYDIMSYHVTELLECARDCRDEQGSPRDRFRELVRRFMSLYIEAGSQHVILLNDIGCLPEDKQKEIQELQDDVVAIVLELICEVNPALSGNKKFKKPVTMALMGMINWTYTWFDEKGPINEQQFADLAVDLFLNGLMSKEFKG